MGEFPNCPEPGHSMSTIYLWPCRLYLLQAAPCVCYVLSCFLPEAQARLASFVGLWLPLVADWISKFKVTLWPNSFSLSLQQYSWMCESQDTDLVLRTAVNSPSSCSPNQLLTDRALQGLSDPGDNFVPKLLHILCSTTAKNLCWRQE